MKKVIFLLFILILTGTLLPAQSMLNEEGFELSWEVREARLIVTLKAETTGWLAFGTDADKRMKNADIIILWVDDDLGIAMGEDHFGTGQFTHREDMRLGGEQNLQVLSGRQTRDSTSVSFAIPLDSGDEYDTLLVSGKTYPLLLAWGGSDNIKTKHKKVYTGTITIP